MGIVTETDTFTLDLPIKEHLFGNILLSHLLPLIFTRVRYSLGLEIGSKVEKTNNYLALYRDVQGLKPLEERTWRSALKRTSQCANFRLKLACLYSDNIIGRVYDIELPESFETEFSYEGRTKLKSLLIYAIRLLCTAKDPLIVVEQIQTEIIKLLPEFLEKDFIGYKIFFVSDTRKPRNIHTSQVEVYSIKNEFPLVFDTIRSNFRTIKSKTLNSRPIWDFLNSKSLISRKNFNQVICQYNFLLNQINLKIIRLLIDHEVRSDKQSQIRMFMLDIINRYYVYEYDWKTDNSKNRLDKTNSLIRAIINFINDLPDSSAFLAYYSSHFSTELLLNINTFGYNASNHLVVLRILNYPQCDFEEIE